MSDWKSNAHGCLAPLLPAGSIIVIIALLYPDVWPRISQWPSVIRIVLAFLLAGLNTLLAPSGEPRRYIAGLLFAIALGNTIMVYGDVLGIHVWWQKALVVLVVLQPFIYFGTRKPRRPKPNAK